MKRLLGPASHTKLSAVINAWLMLSHSHTAAPAPCTCFKQPPLVAVEIGLQGPLYTNAKTAKKEQMKESEKKGERATTFLSIMKINYIDIMSCWGGLIRTKSRKFFEGRFDMQKRNYFKSYSLLFLPRNTVGRTPAITSWKTRSSH